MQAIVETLFDAAYLSTVVTLGIFMIRRSKGNVQYTLFGWMAVVLGAGDSFHLIPRALALCTTGLESYTFVLGLGKWITSVTMTVFYVLLYYVWRRRYQIVGKRGLTAAVYVLAAARVVLCMMPQNRWLTGGAPLAWGIYRNIPFALIGLLVIVLFFRSAKARDDRAFRWMWLTIVLSFGFYIPVVLWADVVPMIGMLMIPQDLRLCVDGAHRLQGHEKRMRQRQVSAAGKICTLVPRRHALRHGGFRYGCLIKKSISFPVQKSASESTLRRSKSGLDAVGRVTAAPDR